MSVTKWLRAHFRRSDRQTHGPDDLEPLRLEALVQAHGDWLALFATILERERVITGDELARTLAEFAAHTAVDRPAEGRILLYWASRLQDSAASLRDFPSIH